MSNPHKGQPVEIRGKPLHESRAVAILLHGRGGDPASIMALAERIDDPDFAYIAPAARSRTWYPGRFMDPIEQNQPHLSYALALCHELVGGLIDQGIDRRRIVLAGFSQGACLAAEYAIRHAGRYGGILLFTGGLFGPPGTRWDYGGSFDGAPILISGSAADGWVPERRMRESADRFRALGADVTERIYPGDSHAVTDAEIAAARSIMRNVAADQGALP